MSSTDRSSKQMREDSLAWRRAGYPDVAVGRYRDAADQMERMARVLIKCRDALPAISTVNAKLYSIPLDLDRQIEACLEPWLLKDPAENEA